MIRKTTRRAVGALALALALGPAVASRADELTSKGTTLGGAVKGLSPAGVAFETEYGKGVILVEWADVEDVRTEGALQVLHGEGAEAVAPLGGLRDGRLVVGEQEVEVATIQSATVVSTAGLGWRDRVRSRWRYWDGSFDVGFNLQQSTTDTTGLLVGFTTMRTKAPTRLLLAAGYRYGTTKADGDPETTTEDELKGLIRGEYDFTPRWYGFASVDGEYDAIERLSVRSVPKAGVGYTLFLQQLDEIRQNFLRAEIGGGYVYQRYFGGETEDYATVALGALATYWLPYGARFDWRFDYLPAIDDWANNFIVRNTASLAVPLVELLSAKFSVVDEYNNQPAEGAAYNSLYLTAGLSLLW